MHRGIQRRFAMNKISFLFASSLLAACAAQNSSTGTVPADDPLAGETNDGEKADGNGVDTFGIYSAVKVGAFECNGLGSCTHVTLTRTNRSTTFCADGAYHASCDVRYLDFSKLGLSASQIDDLTSALQASANDTTLGPQLLVRGKYIHGTNQLYPNVDWVTFQVTEVWAAQMNDGVVDGTFVMLTDNGKRCIDAPCPATTETRINSTRHVDIDGLDWPEAYQKEVTSPGWLPNRVYDAMTQADGVIVVGDRTTGTIMHLPEQLRSVNQAYLLVK
jgi:hypothetical protein